MSLSLQYFVDRVEILCAKCGDEVRVGKPVEDPSGVMERIRFLGLICFRCGTGTRNYRICDLLIVRMLKLTTRSVPLTEQSEDQLTVKIGELKDLICSLRPLVANTSFALGILYREMADIYETSGRMDECVEAYKMLIPVVE